MKRIIYLFLAFTLFILASPDNAKAQKTIVQVSGLVMGGDSLYGIPGAYVFVPETGRGTTSNHIGYFSMPALVNDSIIIRSLGYEESYFIVPDDGRTSISIMIELSTDTTMLPEVEIFPFPTERLFKEAFLALQLPEDELNNMQNNLNDQLLRRMLYNMPAGANANHRYFMQQQMVKTEVRFFQPTLALLNPFAWRQFIEQVRREGIRGRDPDE